MSKQVVGNDNGIAVPAIIQKRSFVQTLYEEVNFKPHWQSLIDAGKEHLAKVKEQKSKKNPYETIITRTWQGQSFTNPTLISIKEGFNFRNFNTAYGIESIKELAPQIKADGIRVPLKCYPDPDGKVYIVDGHRRYMSLLYAIAYLGLDDIQNVPVRPEEQASNDKDRIYSQFSDNQGLRPMPFETAGILARLVKKGVDATELAERTGLGLSSIRNYLDMAEVPAALMMISQETPELKISDSFVHNLYKAEGRKEEQALRNIYLAIETAKAKGSEKVMPKHLPKEAKARYNRFTRPTTREDIPESEQPSNVPQDMTPETAYDHASEGAEDETDDQDETNTNDLELSGNEEEEGGEDNNNSVTTEAKGDEQKIVPASPSQASTATNKPASKPSQTPATNKPASQTSSAPTQKAPDNKPPAASPGPSIHTQKVDNYTMRSALIAFFRNHVQFLPMEEGKMTVKIKIAQLENGQLNDEVDIEQFQAIVHSLGL